MAKKRRRTVPMAERFVVNKEGHIVPKKHYLKSIKAESAQEDEEKNSESEEEYIGDTVYLDDDDEILKDPEKTPDYEDIKPQEDDHRKIDLSNYGSRQAAWPNKSGVTDPDLITNDPSHALSVAMNPNNKLAKYLGDPIANDKLLDAIRGHSATSTIFNFIMEEIAEEAAFLKAWRNENWDSEKDMSEAAYKRIRILKDLVETLIIREKQRQDKAGGKIDFYSEGFKRVLQYFLQVIQATFKKVNIPEQYENIFFSQLAKDFDDFEKKAEKIYYGKGK